MSLVPKAIPAKFQHEKNSFSFLFRLITNCVIVLWCVRNSVKRRFEWKKVILSDRTDDFLLIKDLYVTICVKKCTKKYESGETIQKNRLWFLIFRPSDHSCTPIFKIIFRRDDWLKIMYKREIETWGLVCIKTNQIGQPSRELQWLYQRWSIYRPSGN